MAPVTADICDAQATDLTNGSLRVVPGHWRHFGGKTRFAGSVTTLEAHGCNGEVREILAEPSLSQVLLIDAGNHPEALVGGNLAELASRNGWAGIIIHGHVRDTEELRSSQIGIVALGTWPVRSRNESGGAADLPLLINGCIINPGEWIYVDLDGVLVSQSRLDI